MMKNGDILPNAANTLLAATLLPIFERWYSPSLPIKHSFKPNGDDFGATIDTLLISGELQETSTSFAKKLLNIEIDAPLTFVDTPENMVAICQELGINLVKDSHFNFIRDKYIRLADGSYALPVKSEHLPTALERTHSGNLYLHLSAATHSKNQYFNCWSGNFHASKTDAPPLPPALENIQTLPHTYLEGGNMFWLTNNSGVVQACVGVDHLMHTLQLLELKDYPWDPELIEKSKKIAQELTRDDIYQLAEEMYAMGLLHWQGHSGIIQPNHQLSLLLFKYFSPNPLPTGPAGEIWFKKLAAEAKSLFPFNPSEDEINALRDTTATYATKKELTKSIIANDLMIKSENLHFITQAGYHLDTFLTPAPYNRVFITDYAIAADILKALISNAKQLDLDSNDLVLLERYEKTARKLNTELSPLLNKVAKEMEAIGIKVVPAPSSILYEAEDPHKKFPVPTEPLSINFINGVSGWSDLKHNHYYITHGMQTGNKLGKLIMDAFSLFLNYHVPDIEVYYIGRDSQGDFRESMQWWNRIDTQSGLHCTTLPL